MIIKIDNLQGREVVELMQEHHRDMLNHSPPESVHALDVASLQASDVTFWSAWIEGELAGCGALKVLSSIHGEIKSMRTSHAYRRQGVAKCLLEFILIKAKNRGCQQVSLETGSMDAFEPARKMYEKFGFQYCSPFAEYAEDKYSVFMTKQL
ncbi:MAG: GNAT family N-acetyltransferase [Proteobacteria bacterium]|nr:GNAT family N-acetyltransferase [Pseudomonadota bacterium]